MRAKQKHRMEYVIVRSNMAGVFAGYLREETGNVVVLEDARRIWYWAGAASLSQLAMEGTKKPDECRFPVEMFEVKIFDVIEIIPCTEEARQSIANVPIWEAT